MKFARFAFAAAMALATVTPALAVDTVTAKDPQTVLDALSQLGYQGTLEKLENGRSSIAVQISGLKTYIDFYDCAADYTECYTLLFLVILNLGEGTTLEKANEWNAQEITGRVSLDRDRDPQLDYSISTFEGIPMAVFEENLKLWDRKIGDLKDFFDF